MPMADVFRSDAFRMTSLTAAINEQETPPQRLAELGLFSEQGVATTSIVIEKQGSTLSLVPSKPRGAPGTPMHEDKRRGISLEIPHLPARDTLLADELQNVRAFGSENEMAGVQQKRDERLAAMARSLDYTLENHRIGAVQGLVLDADGSVLFDLYDEFGVDEPDPIYFDLDAAWTSASGGVIERIILNAKNRIRAALKNRVTGIHVLCGETFFSKISTHPEVRETYMGQQEAKDRREGDATDTFNYRGATFEMYPGYGDVEIADTECRFIPLGVPDLFITRFAPAPWFSAVNTLGLPMYAMATPDPTGEKYLELEAQSNPINLCTRPEVLLKGLAGADPG